MATDEQSVVNAQTNVLQQETLMKNLLSRNGVASSVIAEAQIIPTDHIEIPNVEPVVPIQDLVARALDNRPDLAQSRIQVDNAKIDLIGTRNAMLPQLNLVGDARNSGLAGSRNTLPLPGGTTVTPADPFVVGGYGDVLSQMFLRNFPTYSVGATLVIPLRNRSAQADMATAQLQYRQTELGLQKAINQIRVDVQTALTALQQARAQYAAATKGVDLRRRRSCRAEETGSGRIHAVQRDPDPARSGDGPVVPGDRARGVRAVPHSAGSGGGRTAAAQSHPDRRSAQRAGV